MIDPEFELTPVERSELAMIYHSKGWHVVHKICLAVVEQFRVDLDNADHSNPKDVMAKHSLSRSASVVVTQLLTRVGSEAAFLGETRKTKPQESAPGVEMDDIERMTNGLPNLLGDVTYIAEDDDLEEGR
jgi:hypothetical protein